MHMSGLRPVRPVRSRSSSALLAVLLTATLLGPQARADDTYDWEPVTHLNPPTRMVPGEKLVLMVAVRNTGTVTWRADGTGSPVVRLGATNPRGRTSAFASDDPTWMDSGTAVRMTTHVARPGDVATFTFTFTAPAEAGEYEEAFAPVAEGGVWMDANQLVLRTRVEPVVDVADPTVPDVPGAWGVRPADLLPPAFAYGYDHSSFVGSGGSAPGEFLGPTSVALDPVGRLVVADSANDRIQRLSADGVVTQVWGTTGSGPGQLHNPSGVAVSASGHVYVADTGNDRVQVFSLTGDLLHAFGGLQAPTGIALAPDGTVVVADTGNDRVVVTSATGLTIAVIDELSGPHGVAVDDDLVYVADTGGERILRYSRDGELVGVIDGSFEAPRGIAVGPWGIYVADTGSDRIQHFTRTGAHLGSWAQTGSAPGQVRGPVGLALDSTAGLWVAEAGGDRLQQFRPAVRVGPVF